MAPHNLNYDSSSSNETAVKTFKECKEELPTCLFSVHPTTADRLRTKCRKCRALEHRGYMAKLELKRQESYDTAEPEPPVKRQRCEPPIRGEHLYIMAFSTDPEGLEHGFKLGRAGNIAQRAMELSKSMPFHMLVAATFPGQGHLEEQVHGTLASTRNLGGRGREWFRVSLCTVVLAVGCAMQAQVIVNGATGSAQQRPGSPWDSASLAGGEEEGTEPYEEGGGDLCEGEGFEADLSGSSAGER